MWCPLKRPPLQEAALAKWRKPTSEKGGGVGTNSADETRRLLALPEPCEEIVVSGPRFTTVYVVCQGARLSKDGRPYLADTRMIYARPNESRAGADE